MTEREKVMLGALKAQHQAIDILFARLILLDQTFMATRSGKPWEAMLQGNAAIDLVKATDPDWHDQMASEAEATGHEGPMAHHEQLAAALRRAEKAEQDNAEYQSTFNLQWTRSREADAMWKSHHPESKADIPDLGDLLQWMMEMIRAAAPVMMSLGMPGGRWNHIYVAELKRLEAIGDPISLAKMRGMEKMAIPEERERLIAHLKHIDEKDDPMGPE